MVVVEMMMLAMVAIMINRGSVNNPGGPCRVGDCRCPVCHERGSDLC